MVFALISWVLTATGKYYELNESDLSGTKYLLTITILHSISLYISFKSLFSHVSEQMKKLFVL